MIARSKTENLTPRQSPDPLLTEGTVLSGGMVLTSKKRPPNTPLNGVHDTDFGRIKLFNSLRPRHRNLRIIERLERKGQTAFQLEHGWHRLTV